jgi:hypothetical protein
MNLPCAIFQRNISEKLVEEITKHAVWYITFSLKIYLLWDSVEKYCTVGQATGENMPHVHCMLDT